MHERRMFTQKHPVNFISFKDVTYLSNELEVSLKKSIQDTFLQHPYLGEDAQSRLPPTSRKKISLCTESYKEMRFSSLKFLAVCLKIQFQKKSSVLVDEYDAPLTCMLSDSTVDEKQVQSIINHIGYVIGSVLIDNDVISGGVVNASMEMKGTLSCHANNVMACTFLEDPIYKDYLGFTATEVEELLKKPLFQKLDKVDIQEFYKGYKVLNFNIKIYNTYSIVVYLQIESQFTLAGVTTESTKFHHVVSALQPEELAIISDIVISPPVDEPFTALKKRLCAQYVESEAQRFDFGDRLPTNVQQILAISNDNLDKLAAMADGIMATTTNAQSVSVIAGSTDQTDLRSLLTEITARLSRLEARTSDRSRSTSQKRSTSRSRQSANSQYCCIRGLSAFQKLLGKSVTYGAKKEWRPCGDFRRLNGVTVPHRYPVPHMQDCFQVLEGKRIFSTLNLEKAYYQIPVSSEDVPKTAVTTPFGLFEFLYMPFGLSNAAATFQRFIHQVLGEFEFCVPYFDDVLVASKNEEEHLIHLKRVFQRFAQYGVTLNVSKCVLGQASVEFLGHSVTEKGITPLPDKVSAIANFPQPVTIRELRRFLAVLNFYRRFIPRAAHTQAILNEYLKEQERIGEFNHAVPSCHECTVGDGGRRFRYCDGCCFASADRERVATTWFLFKEACTISKKGLIDERMNRWIRHINVKHKEKVRPKNDDCKPEKYWIDQGINLSKVLGITKLLEMAVVLCGSGTVTVQAIENKMTICHLFSLRKLLSEPDDVVLNDELVALFFHFLKNRGYLCITEKTANIITLSVPNKEIQISLIRDIFNSGLYAKLYRLDHKNYIDALKKLGMDAEFTFEDFANSIVSLFPQKSWAKTHDEFRGIMFAFAYKDDMFSKVQSECYVVPERRSRADLVIIKKDGIGITADIASGNDSAEEALQKIFVNQYFKAFPDSIEQKIYIGLLFNYSNGSANICSKVTSGKIPNTEITAAKFNEFKIMHCSARIKKTKV
ncbi:uncharacterized protein [Parasteatoda tepidariorum]|uniref:uncharacterized protein n=1 Tax=Parasteatoda tepidariorum TaxID=114398 RepID=UPI0039BC2B78